MRVALAECQLLGKWVSFYCRRRMVALTQARTRLEDAASENTTYLHLWGDPELSLTKCKQNMIIKDNCYFFYP